jgi:plasmid segregation protein ParM
MANTLTVRAVDVGYGHIKFTDGRDAATNAIRTYSIPSQSPLFKGQLIGTSTSIMTNRDTFAVPVGDRVFEVGRDIHLALSSNQVTEVLDEGFCLSDVYAARLYGALNYMLPSLPGKVIDVLILGLPLTTFRKHREALAGRFTGEFVINDKGTKVVIRQCHVYPQPFGSYMSYLQSGDFKGSRKPMALSVDPGYNTVDWFVCQGMSPSDSYSDAVERGMGAVMRAIADDMIQKHGFDSSVAQIVRRIDASLTTGEPFTLFGRTIDLAPHWQAGQAIIEEAAHEVKNKVVSGGDIDVILMTGGGAKFYAKAIESRFPQHKVVTLSNPPLANVRGFHMIGELLAKSLQNAIHVRDLAAAEA